MALSSVRARVSPSFCVVVGVLAAFAPTASDALSQCQGQLVPNPLGRGTDGEIRAMTMWDSDGSGPTQPLLVVGGYFTVAGTVLARGIATFEPTTGSWGQLGLGMYNGGVESLAVGPDGSLYAAGSFTAAGNAAVWGIAKWNGLDWEPLGCGFDLAGTTVRALLAQPNNELLAAGSFNFAGCQQASRIARWTGSAWQPIGSGLDGTPQALAASLTGRVFVAGTIGLAGGVVVNRIATLDGSIWGALPNGMGSTPAGLNGEIRCILPLPDGSMVFGGNFDTAVGTSFQSAVGVARWAGTSWTPFALGLNDYVNALVLRPNGEMIAGGQFTNSGNVIALPKLARWTGSNWAPLTVGIQGGGYVTTLAMFPNGDMAVGGSFSIAEGTFARNFAIVRWPSAASITSQPTDRLFCLNGPLSLSVTATGTATPTFSWRKNSVPISTSSNPSAATPTLVISQPTTGDQGIYDCVVGNGCSSTTSGPATLTACAADFDCSSALAAQDIFAFLNAWFGGSLSTDFSSDGGLSTLDVFLFLNAWFAGC